MSAILPYGNVGQLSPHQLRLQPEAPPAHATSAPQKPADAEVEAAEAAEEAGLAALARSWQTPGGARDHHSASPLWIRDDRGNARVAYRLGRLRRVHTLVSDAFWGEEVGPRAAELLSAAEDVRRDVHRLVTFQNANPFKRYVYLLEAEQQAAAGSDVAKRLQDAMDKVWSEHAPSIVAGFNTAGALMHFARHVDEWDQMRNIYFALAVHGDSLATTFKALLEKFGPARLRSAIDALRRAVAADLASPIVSGDRERMLQQQGDLERNRTMSSLMADAEDLQRRLWFRTPKPEEVVAFVVAVLEYIAGPVNDRKFNALCALALPGEEIDEIVRRRIREFLKRKLPVWLWGSEDARETLFPLVFRRIPR